MDKKSWFAPSSVTSGGDNNCGGAAKQQGIPLSYIVSAAKGEESGQTHSQKNLGAPKVMTGGCNLTADKTDRRVAAAPKDELGGKIMTTALGTAIMNIRQRRDGRRLNCQQNGMIRGSYARGAESHKRQEMFSSESAADSDAEVRHEQMQQIINTGHQRKQIQTNYLKTRKKQQQQTFGSFQENVGGMGSKEQKSVCWINGSDGPDNSALSKFANKSQNMQASLPHSNSFISKRFNCVNLTKNGQKQLQLSSVIDGQQTDEQKKTLSVPKGDSCPFGRSMAVYWKVRGTTSNNGPFQQQFSSSPATRPSTSAIIGNIQAANQANGSSLASVRQNYLKHENLSQSPKNTALGALFKDSYMFRNEMKSGFGCRKEAISKQQVISSYFQKDQQLVSPAAASGSREHLHMVDMPGSITCNGTSGTHPRKIHHVSSIPLTVADHGSDIRMGRSSNKVEGGERGQLSNGAFPAQPKPRKSQKYDNADKKSEITETTGGLAISQLNSMVYKTAEQSATIETQQLSQGPQKETLQLQKVFFNSKKSVGVERQESRPVSIKTADKIMFFKQGSPCAQQSKVTSSNNSLLKSVFVNKNSLSKVNMNSGSAHSPMQLKHNQNSPKGSSKPAGLCQQSQPQNQSGAKNSCEPAHQKPVNFFEQNAQYTRLCQPSGMSVTNNNKELTSENVNGSALGSFVKPGNDTALGQRKDNFMESKLSNKDKGAVGPIFNLRKNQGTTSTNFNSNNIGGFRCPEESLGAAITKKRVFESNRQSLNQFHHLLYKGGTATSNLATELHGNIYKPMAIKKNSTSTSELLNVSSRSTKNTCRIIKEAAQLKGQKTVEAERGVGSVSTQNKSALKINLAAKMNNEKPGIGRVNAYPRKSQDFFSSNPQNLAVFQELNEIKYSTSQQQNKSNTTKASVQLLRIKQQQQKKTVCEVQVGHAAQKQSDQIEIIKKIEKVIPSIGPTNNLQESDTSTTSELNTKEDPNNGTAKQAQKDKEIAKQSKNLNHTIEQQKGAQLEKNKDKGEKMEVKWSVKVSGQKKIRCGPKNDRIIPDPFQIYNDQNEVAGSKNYKSPKQGDVASPSLMNLGGHTYATSVPCKNYFMAKERYQEKEMGVRRGGAGDRGVKVPTDTSYLIRLAGQTKNSSAAPPHGPSAKCREDGAPLSKNDRISADYNRLISRNQINIFRNSKDSVQVLGPDREGTEREGVNALRNYEFSTPNCSKIDEYTFVTLIGRGAYAEVKEYVHRMTGKRYAVKQYDRYKLLDVNRKKQAIREIKILSSLSHPRIVKLHESIDTAKYVYLVMEYVQGKSLHAHLNAQAQKCFREEKAKRVVKQLLTALEYLHERNVTHRDVKLENIIIDQQEKIKLIDFGFCCSSHPDTKLKVFCGTPSYMAPEIVQRREYSGPPTDIWATGILFYAMLYGRFPFQGKETKDLYKAIARGLISFPDQSNLPEEKRVSLEARTFVQKMLVVAPSCRVSAKKLVSDPYLHGVYPVGGESQESLKSSSIATSGRASQNNIRIRNLKEKKAMMGVDRGSMVPSDSANSLGGPATQLTNVLSRPITTLSKNLNQIYGQQETLHLFKRNVFGGGKQAATQSSPSTTKNQDDKLKRNCVNSSTRATLVEEM